MGLRINTNVGALTALRNLRVADRQQQQSIERLTTGLRINSASDDPAGLVVSEQLRAQISALEQASENTQRGRNLINTADSALQEVQNQLSSIQDSIIFALNDSSASDSEIASEQDTIDAAIAAIDRIARTTTFGDQNLLNGEKSFDVTSSTSDIIKNLNIREMDFGRGIDEKQFTFSVTTSAARGMLFISGVSADTTIRVEGQRGIDEVSFSEGTSGRAVVETINNRSDETGVFGAVSAAQNSSFLLTEEMGTGEQVEIEVVEGTLRAAKFDDADSGGPEFPGEDITGGDTGIQALTAGDSLSDKGKDAEIRLNGQTFTGRGREFNIVENFGRFEFTLNGDFSDGDLSAVGTLDSSGGAGDEPITVFSVDANVGDVSDVGFKVEKSGSRFQLNDDATAANQIRLGIGSVLSAEQGFDQTADPVFSVKDNPEGFPGSKDDRAFGGGTILQGGFLPSLKSGGDNSLQNDPENAKTVIDEAMNQISSLRSQLGSTDQFSLESNLNVLGETIGNLTSAESEIRDVDFARETTRFTRSQVLFQAGATVLAAANTRPETALSLLQGGEEE